MAVCHVAPLSTDTSTLADDPLWFKDAIIYEIHIRAFQDSTNDGIGEINNQNAHAYADVELNTDADSDPILFGNFFPWFRGHLG